MTEYYSIILARDQTKTKTKTNTFPDTLPQVVHHLILIDLYCL